MKAMGQKRCQKPNNNNRSSDKDESKAGPKGPTSPYPNVHPIQFLFERQNIVSDARSLRGSSFYGPELEQRTLICCDTPPITLTEKSSGVSWIGVTGKDSTRVVSMMVSRPRPSGRRQLSVSDVLATALADMTDGACAATAFGKHMPSRTSSKEAELSYAEALILFSKNGLASIPYKAMEPFAVVSVAPGFVEEENGYEGLPLAVRFLEKKLRLNPSFTSAEATRIAICALKYLLGPKFKSDKIKVNGSGNKRGGVGMISASEVDQHLAAMDLTASFDSFASISS